MTSGYYGNYNPYQQQLQQLQQRLQAIQTMPPSQQPMQPTYQQSALPVQEDKVVAVVDVEAAKSINIPLDGSTTYFKYGDTILARRWNVSESKVSNIIYKAQQEEPQTPVEEVITESGDRLKGIEDTLQEILKKVTYPINKKTSKQEKEVEDDK